MKHTSATFGWGTIKEGYYFFITTQMRHRTKYNV